MNKSPADYSIPAHVPGHLVRDFNYINEPRLLADPWGFCDSMNEAPDIFYTPALGGHWVITRNEVADELLHRHDLFSNEKNGIPGVPNTMIPNNLEPPVHGPYRKILMQRVFSPKALVSLEQDFRRFSRAAMAPALEVGQCEFVNTYAAPVPGDLFIRMMGLPVTVRQQLRPCLEAIIRGTRAEERQAGFTTATAMISGWLDDKLSRPPTDEEGHIFAALAEAEVDSRRLLKQEMLSMASLLMLAGLDTVTSSMGHYMHFFALNPAHRQLLIDEPALIPEAVEELLRRFGITNLNRTVVADCEFRGVVFKAGDMILYSTPIMGLDRRRYVDAMTVDFRRPDKKGHLAFATGPHLCAGHYLARMELRLMLEELLPRMPNLRLAPNAHIRYVSGSALALQELPLLWG